jgi:hypothetical protein
MDKGSSNNRNDPRRADAFVDSIEEEIRSEDWQNIWNKHGKLITFAFFAIVVAAGAYSVWQRNDVADREAVSHRYSIVQGLISSGSSEKAIHQIRELANISKGSYSTLARLEYAALLRSSGDEEALAQYKQIAEDKKIDKIWNELAFIFYVNACMDMMPAPDLSRDLDGFIEKLMRLTEGKWKLISLETLAFCYMKQGKKEMAKESLLTLAKTSGVPQNMAERAKILINYMDSC